MHRQLMPSSFKSVGLGSVHLQNVPCDTRRRRGGSFLWVWDALSSALWQIYASSLGLCPPGFGRLFFHWKHSSIPNPVFIQWIKLYTTTARGFCTEDFRTTVGYIERASLEVSGMLVRPMDCHVTLGGPLLVHCWPAGPPDLFKIQVMAHCSHRCNSQSGWEQYIFLKASCEQTLHSTFPAAAFYFNLPAGKIEFCWVEFIYTSCHNYFCWCVMKHKMLRRIFRWQLQTYLGCCQK